MNNLMSGVDMAVYMVQMKKAEGGSKGIQRWLKRQQRRLSGKMLGIGDGANDVAMIQAADVGIGIMGKEGRQVTLTSSLNPFFVVENVECFFGRFAVSSFTVVSLQCHTSGSGSGCT